MNSKHKKPNPTNAIIIVLLAVIIIFTIAHFASSSKKEDSVWETTPIQTGRTIGACTREYDPVCGEDGNTYANTCLADLAKVSYKKWKCDEMIHNIPLDNKKTTDHADEITKNNEEKNICPAVYNPVCGEDGNTYANTCQANVAKTHIKHEGACIEKNTEKANSTSISPISEKPKIEHPQLKPTEKKSEQIENPQNNIILPSEKEATLTGNLSNYDEKKYHLYSNEPVGYSFAFPKNTSYRGFGAREGAQHTLAISTTATGSENFDTADVQIYYYKTTPVTPPSPESITLNNGAKVYIVNKNPNNLTQNIVKTIKESIK